jgi:hypothetical protein
LQGQLAAETGYVVHAYDVYMSNILTLFIGCVANFQLPEEGTIFDKVEYIELSLEEAKPVVEQYNKEGKAAQPPETKRFRGNDRDRYGSGRSFVSRFGR